jgi:histone H3/H4
MTSTIPANDNIIPSSTDATVVATPSLLPTNEADAAKKKTRKTRVLSRPSRCHRDDGSLRTRPLRVRAGRFPQRECMFYQKTVDPLIQKSPFRKILKALNKSLSSGAENHMTEDAKNYIQETVEADQVYHMRIAKMFSQHAKRNRVMPADYKMATLIRKMQY